MGIAQKLRQFGKMTDRIMQALLPPEPGMEDLAAAVGYVEYTGNPYNAVTPDFVGQRLFDTTNSFWYVAAGITSTSWQPDMQGALDASGNFTGLEGASDSSASTIWLFGTSAQQATGKEKYALNRLDTNAGSIARPTNLYVEQATNLGVTMTCDFHALDAYCYGGGSNTRYTANVRLYCVEGQAHFTGTSNQTLGGAVGVYGLAKSSGNAGTTLQVAKGVQAATQNTGAGTTTLAAAFYVVSPTNSGGGTLTTAAGLYLEDITAGTTNYAIYTQAGRVRFFAGTATPAGGTANVGMTMGSAGVGVFWGSGAPTLSAAQGSIYLRTDGGANTRIYSNSDGGTTWAAVTSS